MPSMMDNLHSKEPKMTNAEFVNLFHGSHYDSESKSLHWDNDGEKVKVLLDANGRVLDAEVSYETDDGSWTSWKSIPASFCKMVADGLDKASELGIAFEDLSRVILDSDLKTVVLC